MTEEKTEESSKPTLPDPCADNSTPEAELEQNSDMEAAKLVKPLSDAVPEEKTSKRKRTFGPTLPLDLKERLLGDETSK